MTKSTPPVYPLAASQLTRAEETLADAFDADPMASYFFPCAAARKAGLRRIFRVGLRHGLRYGRVDTVHEGAAVAIWLRSEYATASLARMARTGMLSIPFAVGWGATRRILNLLRFIEAERLRAISSPHWYLFNIAACPDRQGQGLASGLCAPARHPTAVRPSGVCSRQIRNDGIPGPRPAAVEISPAIRFLIVIFILIPPRTDPGR